MCDENPTIKNLLTTKYANNRLIVNSNNEWENIKNSISFTKEFKFAWIKWRPWRTEYQIDWILCSDDRLCFLNSRYFRGLGTDGVCYRCKGFDFENQSIDRDWLPWS